MNITDMSVITAPADTLESRFVDGLTGTGQPVASAGLQQSGLADFLTAGFPDRKSELWKYTPVKRFLEKDFRFVEGDAAPLTQSDVHPFLIPGMDADTLVFVNGVYQEHLSVIGSLPDGVLMGSLSAFTESHPDEVNRYLGTIAHTTDRPFVGLNTAFAGDGVFLFVPDETSLDRPVHALYVSDSDENLFVQCRNLYVFGKGSKASVAETRGKIGSGTSFMNAVTEAVVGSDAWIRMYNIHDEGKGGSVINTLASWQEEKSHFSYSSFALSGDMVRNNLNYLPDGEGCDTHLNGLVLANGTSHIDNHTFVDHAKPGCESSELFKHVLNDKATAVFNGKIFVRQDAQLTNAYQSNKSIVLSDDARVFAKPELEIYADDVKCSHGATFGSLDEEAMFYLRSRGIRQETARRLLLHAFVGDVLATVTIDPLREYLDAEIGRRLD